MEKRNNENETKIAHPVLAMKNSYWELTICQALC